jgi:hypothetical protein
MVAPSWLVPRPYHTDGEGAATFIPSGQQLLGHPPEEILAYFLQVEEKRMGLRANPERARNAVAVLREWREWIWEHAA